MRRFTDRRDAGRLLARGLVTAGALGGAAAGPRSGVVVLGLARGGVVVAAELALALGTRLDVLVVRKLGYPPRPELGLGALAEGGVQVLNRELLDRLQVSQEALDEIIAGELLRLRLRVLRYRGERPVVPVAGRLVIVADDGLATGYTALAAVESARRRGAAGVVLAVPVGAAQALELVRRRADRVVCLRVPEGFSAVGQYYRRFAEVSDQEVGTALARAGVPSG